MMVVCIMNLVPLIVVGKPGSSKTLAMREFSYLVPGLPHVMLIELGQAHYFVTGSPHVVALSLADLIRDKFSRSTMGPPKRNTAPRPVRRALLNAVR